MREEIEVDNHKLMYHPRRVDEYMQKGDCYPVYVEIGPTNRCNHKCVFCALDGFEHGGHDIDKDIMVITLKDMARHGVKSVMFAGEGEPVLHEDIGLFTKKAKQYGLDVSMTTNGALFNTKKREQCLPNLSWIRFSIDSGEPENYSKVHRTNQNDFEKVMNNIKESVIYRNKNNLETTIGTQFLVIPENMGQATKLAKRLKDIGADNLQIKPYSHHPKSRKDFSKFIVNLERYNFLEEELEKFNSKNFKILFRRATAERLDTERNYKECYGLSFFTLIEAKGNIIPCNLFHDNPEFTYGNLYKNSFSEIWEGDKRKKIIQKIRGQGIKACRKGCRLDVINRYLYRIKNPHPHDNFI